MKMSLSSFTGVVAPSQSLFNRVEYGVSSPSRVNPSGLLDYQVPAVWYNAKAIAAFNATVDASDTGTGKTYVACGVARELKLRLLVVCPKSVIPEWRKVIAKFKLTAIDVVGYEKLRGCNLPHLKWVTPTKSEADGKFVWNVPSDALVVFDEAHRCKARASQNAEMLIAARQQGVRIYMASATLAVSPLEMRAIGFSLGLHNLTNYFQWARSHGAENNEWGGLNFDANDARNKAIMFALHKQLFPNRGYRIRISDLGDRFPESQITAVAAGMNGETSKLNHVYADMQQALAKLDERTMNYSQSIFAILLEARQRAELLKCSAYVEMCTDALEDGHSVAIFVNFTPSLELIAERLTKKKIRVSKIAGGQSGDEREKNIEAFQSNEVRVIVCNIAAGGTGVNLHDLSGDHPRFSIISPNYSAVQLKQAIGRVWRQGGLSKSIQKIVFAADTIEEQACEAVRRKIQNLNLLNDGDLTSGISF